MAFLRDTLSGLRSLRPLRTGRGAAILIILTAGLLARALYLAEIVDAPDFTHPAVDAGFHDYWARSMADPDWVRPGHVADPQIESSPFLRPPGYPYFLALVYALSTSYLAPRLVQMALGLASALLGYLIGRRFLDSDREGISGHLLAAGLSLHWVLIYFEGELHASALCVVLLLGLVFLLGRWSEKPAIGRALAAGLAIGLGALVRPNYLAFLPVAIVWAGAVALRRGSGGARGDALRATIGLIVGTLIAVAPATLRNAAVSPDFVLISSNAGINLYIGNNPDANGYVAQEIGALGDFETCYDYPALVASLERELGRELSHAEVSRHFTNEALRFVREDPGRALELTLIKAGLFWGAPEISHNKVLLLEREHSGVLANLPGNFRLLFAAAVCGLSVLVVERWRRARRLDDTQGTDEAGKRRDALVLLAFLLALAYFLSVLPFFAAARYRVPVLPLMMLCTAAGADGLLRMTRAGAWRSLVVPGIAFGAAFYMVGRWSPLYAPNASKWHMDRGRAFNLDGEPERARTEFERALARNPSSVDLRFSMALTHARLGEEERAVELYREVLAAEPEHLKALNNLGSMLSQHEEHDAALELFRRATRAEPDSALSFGNLGTALVRAGDPHAAVRAQIEAARLEPEGARHHRNLAKAHVAARNVGAAIEALDAGRQLSDDPMIKNDLAVLLATANDASLRDGARAVELALEAGRQAGEPRPDLLETLAAAQAEVGDFASAARTVAQALELARAQDQRTRVRRLTATARLYQTGQPLRMPR